MKCSKTYILASVSLAVALMSSTALGGSGGLKFNRSAGALRTSQSSAKLSNKVLTNVKPTQLYSANKATLNTQQKFLGKVSSLPTAKVKSPVLGNWAGKGKIGVLNPVKPVTSINPFPGGKPIGPIVTDPGKGTGPFNPFPGGKPIGPIVTDPGKGTGPFNPFPGGKPIGPIVADPGKGTGPFNPFPGGKPIGPIVTDPVKDPGPFNPFPGGKPIGPIVTDPVKDPGPFNPFPGGKPPVKDPGPFNPFPGGDPPVKDPGNPPADPGNPPADPGNPPADPGNPPADPCPPPSCPPQCPPYDPGYCDNGGWYPVPFPFPVGGGFGGTTTVVQPVYTPVVAEPQQTALGLDLELVEVRQLDRGDMARNLGPAYRVMIRNKNGAAVTGQFNVALAASLGRQATAESAFAMTRVNGLEAGQMLTVEVRLPAKAWSLGQNADGQSVAYAYLTAVADSHQELAETDRSNDFMVLGRGEIVMVAQK